MENVKSPPEKLRAKRAKNFGAFWPLYRGKSSQNGQKYVLYTRIFELTILENIKNPDETFGEIWKILKTPLEEF